MWSLFKAIWSTFAAFGPIGLVAVIGWGVAIGLAALLYKRRTETKALESEIKKTLTDNQVTLTVLNEKYTKMLTSISDDRVHDIKEVTEDYNNLATNTLQTLDRLIYSIELRRTNKG